MTRRRKENAKLLDVEMTALKASSDSHHLWPFSRFCPSNVLTCGDYHWNAGTFAPASIVIDLGTLPVYVTQIALLAEMEPKTGKVCHQIRLGLTRDTLHSVCWYSGVSQHGEWLQLQLDARRESRFVEVVTHESPSWVAWRRIRVWREIV